LIAAVVVGLLCLSVAAVYVWWSSRGPATPVIDLTGLESSVVELITAASRDVSASPQSADAWGKLASVLMHYEFATEAETAFRQAAKLAPADSRWPYLHGLHLATRDWRASLQLLLRAAELDRVSHAPRLQLAQTLFEHGEPAEAEKHFGKILQQSPGHARASLGLARLRFAAGRLDECRQLLAPCLTNVQTIRAAHVLLAQGQLAAGDSAGAAETAQRTKALPEDQPAPDPYWEMTQQWRVDRKARMEQASTLVDAERFEEALAVLAQIESDYPADDEVNYLQGWSLNRLHRYGEAERALREQLRRTPDSAKALSQLGVSLLNLKRYDDAIAVLKTGLQFKPTWREMHFNLGFAYWQQRKGEEALRHLREAQHLDPHHVPTYLALAEVYERQGATNEAAQALRQAMDLDPSNARAAAMHRRLSVSR
jgi:Flp pilus assembly protein TadD